jgi:hypothetical protein
LRGSSKVVRAGPDAVQQWCETGKGLVMGSLDRTNIDKQSLLSFTNAVRPFLDRNDTIQIRVEGSHFNLFCMDLAVLEEIDNNLFPWIRKISGPTTDKELEFLLSNGHKKILCDNLPLNEFKYRIYFKEKFPVDKRFTFISWYKNYPDDLLLSTTSHSWMTGVRQYTQNPFMYVKDDKMLGMVGLYLGGYVRKVEEFILRENALTA